MSHKRVVVKRGKTYGPYLYESYRDEHGRVRKRYLGKATKPVEQNKKKIFLIGFFVMGIVLLFLMLQGIYLSGQSVLSLDDIGNNGNVLTGYLQFVLQQSELIPANTSVVISLNDFQQTRQGTDHAEGAQDTWYGWNNRLSRAGYRTQFRPFDCR